MKKKMLKEERTYNRVTISPMLILFQENHSQKAILPDKLTFKQKPKESEIMGNL